MPIPAASAGPRLTAARSQVTSPHNTGCRRGNGIVLDREDATVTSGFAPDALYDGVVVFLFEVLLVLAAVSVVWFALYVFYRLATTNRTAAGGDRHMSP